MRRSTKWFQRESSQETLANFSKARTIIKTGPTMKTEPTKPTNAEGKKYFVVGESEVGGEEII